ncbi:MAG: hypothetical protein LBS54_08710 [Dysgonamonadaceae bacterium]|nr:hypothetical protein [Dysgonamonadaceae bacterium]
MHSKVICAACANGNLIRKSFAQAAQMGISPESHLRSLRKWESHRKVVCAACANGNLTEKSFAQPAQAGIFPKVVPFAS